MLTSHDDLPHPIPPFAFIRWKENYFFVVMDPEREVFGMAHCNFEPAYDRARFSTNINVKGKVYKYGNAVPFPKEFEMSPKFGDDKLRIEIVASHKEFKVDFVGEELDYHLVFTSRLPTFDFSVCKFAAPENLTYKEINSYGLNTPFEHLQQAMWVRGTLTLRATGETFNIESYGYRDHTWCMRGDNLVKQHTWTGINFENRAFGVMTMTMLPRPDMLAQEGYVIDDDGVRALRTMKIIKSGDGPGTLPALVRYELRDVFGKNYTLETDVVKRLAFVPLYAEPPTGSAVVYNVEESFCRTKDLETGEIGLTLLEMGWSTKAPDADAAKS